MNSVTKSVPKSRVVHGVTVKKLPIGAFIQAIETIRDLPQLLLHSIYPDLSADEAIIFLKNLSTEGVLELLSGAATVLPKKVVSFCAELLCVPENVILEELSPSELADIIAAFWEVNQLSNFLMTMKGVIAKMR